MLAIDTNIVVRLLIADDAAQAQRARALIEAQPVWVAWTVLLESEWVLRSHYRRPAPEIVRTLRSFVQLANVRIDDPGAFLNALDWTEAGMEFTDALHLAAASKHEGFVSFDRELAKLASKLGAPPVRAP